MSILIAVGAISGLTMILATLLVMANYWLHVAEDPRIDQVESMLPHTNCGGCGFPGCRPFAEALLAGEAQPAACTVGTPDDAQRIAAFLGVEIGTQERHVARLACAGGANVSRNHAHYVGLSTCAAATLVGGGGKSCFWGCLGFGDCQAACTFDAIAMNEQRLPVVDEHRCTACGDCVTACPKDLFSLQPVEHRLWVACRSLAAGDELLEDCQVACTACERCARDAPQLIQMRDNLPVIDYSRGPAMPAATQSCPTGAIVWLDAERGPIKGQAARKIIRKGHLHDAPT